LTGARGEATIAAGDREVRVLYTSRALVDAERQLGRPIQAVAQGFVEGSSGYTEIAHLLRVGMEAARRDARSGGRPVTFEDALDVLDLAGFADVANAVMTAVAEALSYGTEETADPNP
jgi:hypothetical protein